MKQGLALTLHSIVLRTRLSKAWGMGRRGEGASPAAVIYLPNEPLRRQATGNPPAAPTDYIVLSGSFPPLVGLKTDKKGVAAVTSSRVQTHFLFNHDIFTTLQRKGE